MNKYKGLIIVAVLVVIYALSMFVLFGTQKNTPSQEDEQIKENEYNTTNSSEKYFVTIDKNSYRLRGTKLEKVSKGEISSAGKMKVYTNGKYLGDYRLRYGSTWNLFDDDGNFVNYEGQLISASENVNLKVRNIKIRDLNEEDKVELINKYSINTFNYLTTKDIIEFDLDHNGVNDKIICLSSKEDSGYANTMYDLVVIKFNGEYQEVINNTQNETPITYNINSIVNTLNNKVDSILLKKNSGIYSDDVKEEYMLINYKNGKYTID